MSEEKDKQTYELREVPVQTDIVIAKSDMKPEEYFTDKGLLLEILNKLDKIEKRIG